MRANSLAVPTTRAVPTTTLWFGAILLLVVIALLPAVPPLYHTPDTDSSIFLFIGGKINQGDLPFRDWYDHKPPLIFYLNALGLWLGQGSRWGVWAIELVSLSAASLLCFSFLRRFYGALTAFLATGAFLLNLAFVHQRGNLTEEYALPFQFAAIFLTAGLDRQAAGGARTGLRFFAIGAMLAMASSLKQPLAGTGAAVAITLLVLFASQDRVPALLRGFAWMALGFAAVWAAWFAYFALAGIFPEFWEAAFAYNFALSGIPLEKRIRALISGMELLYSLSGFFLAGMLAWLAAISYVFTRDDRTALALVNRPLGRLLGAGGLALLALGLLRQPLLAAAGLAALALAGLILSGATARLFHRRVRTDASARRSELFLPIMIALVDLPVAVAFSSLSGNNFGHYFMALLPSLALLTAFLIHSLVELFSSGRGEPVRFAWVAALLLPIFVPGILETADRIGPRGDRQVEAVVRYVEEHTRPGDYVLQWGIVPQVNLLSGRDAPSRYFFPDPLFVDGYSGTIQTGELLRDLQARPPVLIVDQGIARLPLLLPAAGQSCESVRDPQVYERFKTYWKERVLYDLPQMPQGMDAVYYWICQNYTSAGLVGELGWPVYRWKGN